jgi:hypothetical protein
MILVCKERRGKRREDREEERSELRSDIPKNNNQSTRDSPARQNVTSSSISRHLTLPALYCVEVDLA